MVDKLQILMGKTVLFVEDEKSTRELCIMLLSEYFGDVISASDGLEGLEMFAEYRPDVVITDINMPNMNGLEMIKKIKKIEPNVSALVASAYSDVEYFTESIRLKVDDYIQKPIEYDNLTEALLRISEKYDHEDRRHEEIIRLKETIQRQEQMLEQKKQQLETKTRMALYDHLTGLCNRHCLYERYRSIGSNVALGLILMDIDDFKRINDTHGHDVGDAVLKGVAEITSSNLRETDQASRWGGEEFVIMVLSDDLSCLTNVAERIRGAIESHEFDIVGKVTSSFGITMRSRDDDFESMLKRCDNALYTAKGNGKNRVCRAES